MGKSKLIIISIITVCSLLSLASINSLASCKTKFWIGGGVLLNQYPLGPRPLYCGGRPYWHSPDYPFRYPYYPGYGYGYPYHYYPKEEKSPYSDLDIKSAGELIITVEPLEADVLVDGYVLMPDENLTYSIGLLTGEHQVEVKAQGYKPYSEDIEIRPAKSKTLSIKLEKEKK